LNPVETTQLILVKKQQQIKTNKQIPPDRISTTCTEKLSKKSLFLHHLPGSLLKSQVKRK